MDFPTPPLKLTIATFFNFLLSSFSIFSPFLFSFFSLIHLFLLSATNFFKLLMLNFLFNSFSKNFTIKGIFVFFKIASFISSSNNLKISVELLSSLARAFFFSSILSIFFLFRLNLCEVQVKAK